ncbi:MAG TPA: radical SAM protein [Elusimicrobiales bacterium]|nr:radical SAM protein [Elusimicrobiales bacterium]
MYTRIDIKVTFRCNNKCDFCAQGHKRDLHPDRTKAKVYEDLTAAYKRGTRGVVFTGGEPTMHPSIVDFVAMAKKLGYLNIQLQTNGRTFAYKSLLEKLRDAGANEMGPSLHGACAETHDGLTRAPGSFVQTTAGIRNASQLGLKIITNSVITSSNYRELPALAAILVKLGVMQYQFAFVHIIGTAQENKKWIVPKKSVIMPFVKKGLDVGIRSGVACYTEAIPFCMMQGYEQCVAESIIPEGPVADADKFIKSYGDYRRTEGKAKGPLCKTCRYFKICEGPWREYPEIYGWKEFHPVAGPAKKKKAA